MYGGLPPDLPPTNPRRGSATGSYGLPCPPEWMRRGRDSPTTSISERRQKALTPKGFARSNGTTVHISFHTFQSSVAFLSPSWMLRQ